MEPDHRHRYHKEVLEMRYFHSYLTLTFTLRFCLEVVDIDLEAMVQLKW